jgi:hypothetical protein
MSYLIQNFFLFNNQIKLTPRLKNIILINQNFLCLFFFKFIFFQKFSWFKNVNFFFFIFQLFKYFYNQFFIKYLYTITFKYFMGITSNFKLMLVYLYIKNLSLVINNKTCVYYKSSYGNRLISNLIYLPIRTAPFKVNFKFYKNIFFYLLFFNINYFYQSYKKFNYYYNFILISNEIQIYNFYNGYFFNVYHF